MKSNFRAQNSVKFSEKPGILSDNPTKLSPWMNVGQSRIRKDAIIYYRAAPMNIADWRNDGNLYKLTVCVRYVGEIVIEHYKYEDLKLFIREVEG